MAHDLADASLCESLFPKRNLFLSERVAIPLTLIACEKLDRGGANPLPMIEGIVDTSCSGGVRSDPALFRQKLPSVGEEFAHQRNIDRQWERNLIHLRCSQKSACLAVF